MRRSSHGRLELRRCSTESRLSVIRTMRAGPNGSGSGVCYGPRPSPDLTRPWNWLFHMGLVWLNEPLHLFPPSFPIRQPSCRNGRCRDRRRPSSPRSLPIARIRHRKSRHVAPAWIHVRSGANSSVATAGVATDHGTRRAACKATDHGTARSAHGIAHDSTASTTDQSATHRPLRRRATRRGQQSSSQGQRRHPNLHLAILYSRNADCAAVCSTPNAPVSSCLQPPVTLM